MGRSFAQNCPHPDRISAAWSLCGACYITLTREPWWVSVQGNQHPGCHPDRKYKANGLCGTCYSREISRQKMSEDPDKVRAYRQNWYQRNKDKVKQKVSARRYRLAYGVSLEFIESETKRVGGRCEICSQTADLHVDHDHSTGKYRGLLCSSCNKGIGMLRDDPDRLRSAAMYLEAR